ncbi:MAG: acetyl-CoA acetyltransferase [Sphingorhabdus sp.]
MTDDPNRIPVIIGVGQINDRPDTLEDGLDSLGLMAAALRAAESDVGGPLLADIQSLAIVDQISFRELGNLCLPLASAIGATPAINYQSEAPHGDTPIRLLNEAANRIGAGEIQLAAVAGGEALRTAAHKQAAMTADGKVPNLVRSSAARRDPGYAGRYGLMSPVDVYPLYENAGRAAYGQSLEEAQAESGTIWAQFSEVAEANAGAWIRKVVSIDEIVTPDAKNRPLAFPYSKLMVANSSVNQGAAFIVASLAEARRREVPEDRIIYVGMGAAAKEDHDFLKRDRYDRSVSMNVALQRTMALNQLTSSDLDFVELYSCFPCVPKMARRTLGWPLDKPATVFGGLTFGGGPIANYMSHAVVSMVEKLRNEGRFGFLFANGGYATDNHCIVLSNAKIEAASFPQDFNYQDEADQARAAIPLLDKEYQGSATVETFTVFYDRDGSAKSGVVVCKTETGERTLALIDVSQNDMLTFFTSGETEPVGTSGTVVFQGGQRYWNRRS